MVVMAPGDENELRRMLITAIAHDGPIAIRYPRGVGTGIGLDADPAPLAIGKAEAVASGSDVVILAIGRMVCESLIASRTLKKEGISASVVNMRFVKPLDSEYLLETAGRFSRIITAEENTLQGGFGSAVLECLADNGIQGCHVHRVGLPDRFVEHGASSILRAESGVDAAGIVQAARKMMDNG
jgi:1-deoxy-D-xylulose-5-phosphate synthase